MTTAGGCLRSSDRTVWLCLMPDDHDSGIPLEILEIGIPGAPGLFFAQMRDFMQISIYTLFSMTLLSIS